MARIVSRDETPVSPWVRLVAKGLELAPGQPPEIYHCFAQADYVVCLARTRDGRFPLVAQFRPAAEAVTWELPAGLVESGESPEHACRRELLEETGLVATAVHDLGWVYPDTARLENRLHVFWADTGDPDPAFTPEPGMQLELVTLDTLKQYVRDGTFRHQLCLGAIAQAWIAGLLS